MQGLCCSSFIYVLFVRGLKCKLMTYYLVVYSHRTRFNYYFKGRVDYCLLKQEVFNNLVIQYLDLVFFFLGVGSNTSSSASSDTTQLSSTICFRFRSGYLEVKLDDSFESWLIVGMRRAGGAAVSFLP